MEETIGFDVSGSEAGSVLLSLWDAVSSLCISGDRPPWVALE